MLGWKKALHPCCRWLSNSTSQDPFQEEGLSCWSKGSPAEGRTPLSPP